MHFGFGQAEQLQSWKESEEVKSKAFCLIIHYFLDVYLPIFTKNNADRITNMNSDAAGFVLKS